VLSRAFRSRFLELHVGDIPDGELATILEGRCALAPSYAAKLVAVMRALQRRRQARALRASLPAAAPLRVLQGLLSHRVAGPVRAMLLNCPKKKLLKKEEKKRLAPAAQGSNVFAGKHGFITPRDLFKWAARGAVGYQELAESGFLLLGERLRQPAERAEVQQVIEATLNVKVRGLYPNPNPNPHPALPGERLRPPRRSTFPAPMPHGRTRLTSIPEDWLGCLQRAFLVRHEGSRNAPGELVCAPASLEACLSHLAVWLNQVGREGQWAPTLLQQGAHGLATRPGASRQPT